MFTTQSSGKPAAGPGRPQGGLSARIRAVACIDFCLALVGAAVACTGLLELIRISTGIRPGLGAAVASVAAAAGLAALALGCAAMREGLQGKPSPWVALGGWVVLSWTAMLALPVLHASILPAALSLVLVSGWGIIAILLLCRSAGRP